MKTANISRIEMILCDETCQASILASNCLAGVDASIRRVPLHVHELDGAAYVPDLPQQEPQRGDRDEVCLRVPHPVGHVGGVGRVDQGRVGARPGRPAQLPLQDQAQSLLDAGDLAGVVGARGAAEEARRRWVGDHRPLEVRRHLCSESGVDEAKPGSPPSAMGIMGYIGVSMPTFLVYQCWMATFFKNGLCPRPLRVKLVCVRTTLLARWVGGRIRRRRRQ